MKSRMIRGFTLIELLVVMVILGILVSIALPNYIRARDKAKETQIKANIHIIQMALERYAVENAGLYPQVVTGGDQEFNIASADGGPYASSSGCNPGTNAGESAFLDYDGSWLNPPDFVDCNTNRPYCLPELGTLKQRVPEYRGPNSPSKEVCMDMLLMFGYLSEYPKNPFIPPNINSVWAAGSPYVQLYSPGYAVGGRYGNLMFDLGWGKGESVWTDLWANDMSGYRQQYGPPSMDVPGQFFYHPVFCDGETVDAHLEALNNTGSLPAARILSHAVCGYVLVGFGSIKTLGYDYMHRSCCEPPGAGGWCWTSFGGAHGFLTGYFSFEPDPMNVPFYKVPPSTWQCTYTITPLKPGDEVGPSGSGPDGTPDQIITLVYGGLDKEPKRELK